MSHFSVLVCLPADTSLEQLETRLEEIMAPWDENLNVAPYREYEEGAASDHWWASSLRHSAANHKALADFGADAFIDQMVSKLREQRRTWNRDLREKVRRIVEENAAEWAEDAKWASELADPVTWENLVQLYNARFHPHDALAIPGTLADGDRLHYDPETGGAYTWSTRNREAKWDYWSIGGRWRGHFLAKDTGPGLISTPEQQLSPSEPADDRGRYDGGPKSLLDFERMRDEAASRARTRYDEWEAVCEGTPVAKPWSHFVGLVKAQVMTMDDARQRYGDQPRIVKARMTELASGWGEGVVEEFLPGRAEYVAQARAAAVPGYALVTLDRRWLAPGRMGWFGLSSDGSGEREAYNVEVNGYLDGLHDDNFVVVLDCHI